MYWRSQGLLSGSASNDCISQNYRLDAAGPYHLNLNLANCARAPKGCTQGEISAQGFIPGADSRDTRDCFEGLLPGSASDDCISQQYRPDAAGPYHLNLNLANCVSKNYRPDAAGPSRPEYVWMLGCSWVVGVTPCAV